MLALIKKTWTEVAFLLGVSGGFWLTLEPPVGGLPGALSGFVGALTLAAALGVRSVLEYWQNQLVVRTAIIVLGFALLVAAVPTFAIYFADRSNLVLTYQGTNIVRGIDHHPHILDIKKKHQSEEGVGITDIGLLTRMGENGATKRDLVWTRESILAAERRLSVGYAMCLLLTLLSTIFFVEILRIGRTST